MKMPASLLAAALLSLSLPGTAHAGQIGGDDEGRCEMLDSEATETCTGKGKNQVCETIDTFCGSTGSDGVCSCEAGCEASGTCCGDYAPV